MLAQFRMLEIEEKKASATTSAPRHLRKAPLSNQHRKAQWARLDMNHWGMSPPECHNVMWYVESIFGDVAEKNGPRFVPGGMIQQIIDVKGAQTRANEKEDL